MKAIGLRGSCLDDRHYVIGDSGVGAMVPVRVPIKSPILTIILYLIFGNDHELHATSWWQQLHQGMSKKEKEEL
jgi:hypothetical protein